MTYKEIAHEILDMTEEQQNQDATVYDASEDEFYPVQEVSFEVVPSDTLDAGHPFLIVKYEEPKKEN